jgi:hypothetical protein
MIFKKFNYENGMNLLVPAKCGTRYISQTKPKNVIEHIDHEILSQFENLVDNKLNDILINGKCKEIPKAEINYIGKSLNESFTDPEKIEIFGNNDNLYNQLNNIKNVIDNYIYCKTIDENTNILSKKNRKIILSNLKNKIKNNPLEFGIKNLDYFNKKKNSLGKNKVCNILYNNFDKI